MPAIGNLQPEVPLKTKFVTSNHPAGAVTERQRTGRERKQFERGFYLPGKDEISKSQLTGEEKVLNHLERPGWLTKTGLSQLLSAFMFKLKQFLGCFLRQPTENIQTGIYCKTYQLCLH